MDLDAEDVYSLIHNIRDPEHSEYSLGDLEVVSRDRISVYPSAFSASTCCVDVMLRPTAPKCSLLSIIGLSVAYALDHGLPHYLATFRVCVKVEPGTHDQWEAVSKQLRDKERRCAAMECPDILAQMKKVVPE